jgi:DNA-binding transcriptional regulator YiaG
MTRRELIVTVMLRYNPAVTPQQVRQARKVLGLSQSAFAEIVGVNRVSVARWETGTLGMRQSAERLIKMLVAQHRAPRRGRR